MTTGGADPELTELLAELTRELQRVEREIEPKPRGRLPTRQELARFTSEVAIPGLILLLQTQIRALELLRRTIRLAEGREPTPHQRTVKHRAEQLGTATLSQLDSVLTELHATIDGRPEDDRAKRLLDDAKRLQEQIQAELAEGSDAAAGGRTNEGETSEELSEETGTDPLSAEPGQSVAIDVEEELRSLKGTLDDDTPSADDKGPDENDNDEGPKTDTGPESDE